MVRFSFHLHVERDSLLNHALREIVTVDGLKFVYIIFSKLINTCFFTRIGFGMIVDDDVMMSVPYDFFLISMLQPMVDATSYNVG